MAIPLGAIAIGNAVNFQTGVLGASTKSATLDKILKKTNVLGANIALPSLSPTPAPNAPSLFSSQNFTFIILLILILLVIIGVVGARLRK